MPAKTATTPDFARGVPQLQKRMIEAGLGHWSERELRYAYERQTLPLFKIGPKICGRISEIDAVLRHKPRAA